MLMCLVSLTQYACVLSCVCSLSADETTDDDNDTDIGLHHNLLVWLIDCIVNVDATCLFCVA